MCTITASAPASSTYSAASVTQSFTIYPAVLKVTATSVSILYGQPIPAFAYTYSGFVNNESASVISGAPALSTTATAGSNAGNYPITVSTGSLAATNYSFLYVSGTLTIGKATATINVTPYSVAYNGQPHTATGTATGVGGVTLLGLALNTTTTHTAAGTYTDTWTFTDTTGNYNNASSTITDTILATPLTIAASSASMTYGGPIPPVTATYTGFVNHESASNLTTQPICTTSATSTSPVGTYISICSNALDPNYSIGYVSGTVQVNQASSTTAVTSSSSGNTSTFGQSVTFTATVTPQYSGTTPTGTVTFYNNGSQIGTGTLNQGQAAFSTSSLPARRRGKYHGNIQRGRQFHRQHQPGHQPDGAGHSHRQPQPALRFVRQPEREHYKFGNQNHAHQCRRCGADPNQHWFVRELPGRLQADQQLSVFPGLHGAQQLLHHHGGVRPGRYRRTRRRVDDNQQRRRHEWLTTVRFACRRRSEHDRGRLAL